MLDLGRDGVRPLDDVLLPPKATRLSPEAYIHVGLAGLQKGGRPAPRKARPGRQVALA